MKAWLVVVALGLTLSATPVSAAAPEDGGDLWRIWSLANTDAGEDFGAGRMLWVGKRDERVKDGAGYFNYGDGYVELRLEEWRLHVSGGLRVTVWRFAPEGVAISEFFASGPLAGKFTRLGDSVPPGSPEAVEKRAMAIKLLLTLRPVKTTDKRIDRKRPASPAAHKVFLSEQGKTQTP